MTYTEEVVIETHELSKAFGPKEVLKDITLTLGPGINALLGPNGAGKTTLVNILSTLLPPDAGTAQIFSLDVVRERRRLQGQIALTGQYAAVDEQLTGMENIMMMGQLFGFSSHESRRRSLAAFERFDLTGAMNKRVSTYSGGMRRKLDIAMSLIAEPRLLFLDEPTTGLDTRSRLALWEEIRRLADQGTAVFLTTQYLEEADTLADRIMVLNGGNIVADGTAKQLKSLVGGATVQLHDGLGRLVEEQATEGTAVDVAQTMAMLAEEHPELAVTIRRPTLDEVFMQLTETGNPAQHTMSTTATTSGDRV